MPESKLNGKSRDDLATIAVVSGLLPSDQAAAMSKAELLKFLKKAEQSTPETTETTAPKGRAKAAAASTTAKTKAAKAAKPATDEPAGDSAPKAAEPQVAELQTAEPQAAQMQPVKSTTRKTPAKSTAKTAAKDPAKSTAKATTKAAPAKAKAAEAPVVESEAQIKTAPVDQFAAEPQREPASAQPVEVPAQPAEVPAPPAEAPVQRLPVNRPAQPKAGSQAAQKAKPQPQKAVQKPGRPVERPTERPATRPTTGQTGAGRTAASRTAPSANRNTGKKPGDTRFNKNPKQPAQPTRPMRVKVFGVPSNPLAAQSDEHEAALLLQQQGQLEQSPVARAAQADLQLSSETRARAEAAALTEISDMQKLDRINREEAGEVEAEGSLINQAELPVMGDLPDLSEGIESSESAGPGRDKAARKAYIESGESITGVLEIMPDGYGFLRRENYIQGARDAYVPPQYIRRFNLRPGDLITGPCKKQRDNDRYQALLYIKEVNGESPDKMLKRPHFDRLTPIYPDERFILETTRNELSTRIIDLVSPIGKGQRGMIVSPPKAGKTILLQKIANAISENNPDVKLIVLLIDERPEEVTDMQRSINGEVVYSTFDKTPENHVKITELVLERAMRLVELKQDVVILLDSMTRLGRAYNLTITPTGRTLSGGLDPGALHGPKRFFGAARNIENGGSLTIIATSLIETGSRMDEVIFEEFKGTGNMEVLLDRKLSEKRIFPAIDINKSGTRREELLLTGKELDAVWTIRKAFGQLDTAAVTETIINLLLKTQNNQQFISSVNVSFNDKNVFDAMRGTRPGNNNN